MAISNLEQAPTLSVASKQVRVQYDTERSVCVGSVLVRPLLCIGEDEAQATTATILINFSGRRCEAMLVKWIVQVENDPILTRHFHRLIYIFSSYSSSFLLNNSFLYYSFSPESHHEQTFSIMASNNSNRKKNDPPLQDVPLTAAGAGGIRFAPDVLLYGENGDVATLALSQVDGPNYTVQQHILAQRALRSLADADGSTSLLSLGVDDLLGDDDDRGGGGGSGGVGSSSGGNKQKEARAVDEDDKESSSGSESNSGSDGSSGSDSRSGSEEYGPDDDDLYEPPRINNGNVLDDNNWLPRRLHGRPRIARDAQRCELGLHSRSS